MNLSSLPVRASRTCRSVTQWVGSPRPSKSGRLESFSFPTQTTPKTGLACSICHPRRPSLVPRFFGDLDACRAESPSARLVLFNEWKKQYPPRCFCVIRACSEVGSSAGDTLGWATADDDTAQLSLLSVPYMSTAGLTMTANPIHQPTSPATAIVIVDPVDSHERILKRHPLQMRPDHPPEPGLRVPYDLVHQRLDIRTRRQTDSFEIGREFALGVRSIGWDGHLGWVSLELIDRLRSSDENDPCLPICEYERSLS